mgnify:FL=1
MLVSCQVTRFQLTQVKPWLDISGHVTELPNIVRLWTLRIEMEYPHFFITGCIVVDHSTKIHWIIYNHLDINYTSIEITLQVPCYTSWMHWSNNCIFGSHIEYVSWILGTCARDDPVHETSWDVVKSLLVEFVTKQPRYNIM